MKKQKLNSGVVEKTVIQQHSTEQQYMEGMPCLFLILFPALHTAKMAAGTTNFKLMFAC